MSNGAGMNDLWLTKLSDSSYVTHTENVIGITNISVYPNPAHDYIKVISQVEGTFRIYTLNGEEVVSGFLPNLINTIYVNDLLPGIYLFQIEINEDIINKKLLVQ